MNSQNTVKKAEEFFNLKSETPLDPFAVDIFGAGKTVEAEETESFAELREAPEKKAEKPKERPLWNESLPKLTAREVEFSRLLQNLPKNLTRRAAVAIEETIARYTFQTPNDVKCRLASVAEVNLSDALDGRAATPRVFLTLGCQPKNARAVIALNADFASSVIDLILGGQTAERAAPRDLSPIENVIIEFLAINITGEINDWFGQTVLCLQKVTSENSAAFETSERGAESVFNFNLSSFGGTVSVFSGWDFLDGLDKTQNPLFEKKSPDKQIQKFEKIALKLDLRLPIGTTFLSADSLLYLEADDIILIEEPENNFADAGFSGNLQVYVGAGKNFFLSGKNVPNESNEELNFRIDEISSSEERHKLTETKLKMDEKETEEIETERDAAEDSEQTDDRTDAAENAAILSNVLVNLRVEIAGGKISLNELQTLRSGQIIPLGCRPNDAVRIVTDSSDQPVASGELVDVEGKLGVRVTRVFI